MSRRPHVVIFNPDQWRGDVMGHLGNPAAITPQLDRLVRDEAVSSKGHSAGTQCARRPNAAA